MASIVQHPRIEQLARSYVRSRARSCRDLVSRYDETMGTRLAERIFLPGGPRPTEEELRQFDAFAERTLWEQASEKARQCIVRLVVAAMSMPASGGIAA